jgi:hypothetical protein
VVTRYCEEKKAGGTLQWPMDTKLQCIGEISVGILLHNIVTIYYNNIYFKEKLEAKILNVCTTKKC